MKLQAAAFDLDDTLLHDDLTLSPYTLDIFRRLHDTGFQFIAASGRTPLSMRPFVDQLGCVSISIACNGAVIIDSATGQAIHREVFSVELAREIARFGNEHQCYAQTYSDDRFYFNEYSEYSKKYASASMLPGEYVGDLETYIREPRSKILMMADEAKIASMLAEASERFKDRVSVTCSKPWFLEFNPIRATKGIALRKSAELLGVSTDEIVAFGDSLNDLPMLLEAGSSVCVSNARPDVRSCCSAVCLSNQEDGVARYLAEHVLYEEVSN